MLDTLRANLSKACFTSELKSTYKSGVLAELADLLVANGAIQAARRDAILAALIERETKMSTGMQSGVAIPHAKTPLVDHFISAVALSGRGVNFDSLDGQPTHIFVLTISPDTEIGGYIRFLADISRQLSSRAVREKLLEARTPEAMVAALCDTH